MCIVAIINLDFALAIQVPFNFSINNHKNEVTNEKLFSLFFYCDTWFDACK